MKKGIIITLLGGTFWGISGTMGQFLFQTYHLNTMWLTTLRMIFAGIILLSVCFIKDTKKTLSIWNNKNDVLSIFLYDSNLLFKQFNRSYTTILESNLYYVLYMSCL